jgi:hypothetical protein
MLLDHIIDQRHYPIEETRTFQLHLLYASPQEQLMMSMMKKGEKSLTSLTKRKKKRECRNNTKQKCLIG